MQFVCQWRRPHSVKDNTGPYPVPGEDLNESDNSFNSNDRQNVLFTYNGAGLAIVQ